MKIFPISKDEYLTWRDHAKDSYHRLSMTIRQLKRERINGRTELDRRIAQKAVAKTAEVARDNMFHMAWLKACARASVELQHAHYDRLPAIQQTETRW